MSSGCPHSQRRACVVRVICAKVGGQRGQVHLVRRCWQEGMIGINSVRYLFVLQVTEPPVAQVQRRRAIAAARPRVRARAYANGRVRRGVMDGAYG